MASKPADLIEVNVTYACKGCGQAMGTEHRYDCPLETPEWFETSRLYSVNGEPATEEEFRQAYEEIKATRAGKQL